MRHEGSPADEFDVLDLREFDGRIVRFLGTYQGGRERRPPPIAADQLVQME